MSSCALWNDRSKSSRYELNGSKAGAATSITVIIFLIVASTSVALSYIRLHVEQNNLNAEINALSANMAIRSKEIDNLQVRLEHLKGQEVMRFAPRLGLQPPALGQVTRISLFRNGANNSSLLSRCAEAPEHISSNGYARGNQLP
jgi:hypothetical protein